MVNSFSELAPREYLDRLCVDFSSLLEPFERVGISATLEQLEGWVDYLITQGLTTKSLREFLSEDISRRISFVILLLGCTSELVGLVSEKYGVPITSLSLDEFILAASKVIVVPDSAEDINERLAALRHLIRFERLLGENDVFDSSSDDGMNELNELCRSAEKLRGEGLFSAYATHLRGEYCSMIERLENAETERFVAKFETIQQLPETTNRFKDLLALYRDMSELEKKLARTYQGSGFSWHRINDGFFKIKSDLHKMVASELQFEEKISGVIEAAYEALNLFFKDPCPCSGFIQGKHEAVEAYEDRFGCTFTSYADWNSRIKQNDKEEKASLRPGAFSSMFDRLESESSKSALRGAYASDYDYKMLFNDNPYPDSPTAVRRIHLRALSYTTSKQYTDYCKKIAARGGVLNAAAAIAYREHANLLAKGERVYFGRVSVFYERFDDKPSYGHRYDFSEFDSLLDEFEANGVDYVCGGHYFPPSRNDDGYTVKEVYTYEPVPWNVLSVNESTAIIYSPFLFSSKDILGNVYFYCTGYDGGWYREIDPFKRAPRISVGEVPLGTYCPVKLDVPSFATDANVPVVENANELAPDDPVVMFWLDFYRRRFKTADGFWGLEVPLQYLPSLNEIVAAEEAKRLIGTGRYHRACVRLRACASSEQAASMLRDAEEGEKKELAGIQRQLGEISSIVDEGRLQDAKEALSKLTDYEPCVEKLHEVEEALLQKQYEDACKIDAMASPEEAMRAFKSLGAYKDAEKRCQEAKREIDYRSACQHMDSGEFEQAAKLFKKISGYRDAQQLREVAEDAQASQIGMALLRKGEIKASAGLFQQIHDSRKRRECFDKVEETLEHDGLDCLERGDYESGLELFAQIENSERRINNMNALQEFMYQQSRDLIARQQYSSAGLLLKRLSDIPVPKQYKDVKILLKSCEAIAAAFHTERRRVTLFGCQWACLRHSSKFGVRLISVAAFEVDASHPSDEAGVLASGIIERLRTHATFPEMTLLENSVSEVSLPTLEDAELIAGLVESGALRVNREIWLNEAKNGFFGTRWYKLTPSLGVQLSRFGNRCDLHYCLTIGARR